MDTAAKGRQHGAHTVGHRPPSHMATFVRLVALHLGRSRASDSVTLRGSPLDHPTPQLSDIRSLAALSKATAETEADLLEYADKDMEVFVLYKVDIVGKKKIKREPAWVRALAKGTGKRQAGQTAWCLHSIPMIMYRSETNFETRDHAQRVACTDRV